MINREKLLELCLFQTAKFNEINYLEPDKPESPLVKRVRIAMEGNDYVDAHGKRYMADVISALINEKISLKGIVKAVPVKFAVICLLKDTCGHNYRIDKPAMVINGTFSAMLRPARSGAGNNGEESKSAMRPALPVEIKKFIAELDEEYMNHFIGGISGMGARVNAFDAKNPKTYIL